MKTAPFPRHRRNAVSASAVLAALTFGVALLGCASAPDSYNGHTDTTTRAPLQWPDLQRQAHARLFVADLLDAPGESQLDTALVHIDRLNERVFRIEYRFRHAIQSEGPHAVDADRQNQLHQCIAVRLAHGLGFSHWDVGPGFDDVAFVGDRAVRQLAFVLQPDHQAYLHLLPQDLRASVTAREPADARPTCEGLMRPEFISW